MAQQPRGIISFPNASGSSTDSTLTPPTSMSPESLAGTSKSESAMLLENMDSFIAVGVLESNQAITSATAFPRTEIARLEKENWIRTTTHQDEEHPHLSYVRVYVLPDDLGRRFIDRHNTALRRDLRMVMSKVDPSPRAWNGGARSSERIKAITLESTKDESLWYIFNTLENPAPMVETIKDPFAKHAMLDLLSIPPTGEIQDDEVQTYTGVLGLKTPLYPYQRRSAATMIQREVQPHQMLDPRLQVCTGPTGQEYYYDRETGNIVREKRLYSEAPGGILAETMGCGKTLICLAVILATSGHFPQIPFEYQTMQNPVRPRTGRLLDMAAASAGRLSLPWKGHFDSLRKMGEYYEECVKACEAHRGTYKITPPPGRYTSRAGVDSPRLAEVHLHLCSGTLIIVPPNLLDHWVSEITIHTEGLNVLVLRGNADTLPAVKELLAYDIVLFSRTRFEKEADDFSDGGWDRHKESSPLTRVHWLRVVVDEGHNVAGHGHRTTMMHLLDQLHIERRWVVSGTPSSGLYGVEVSLASQETHTDDTDLTEATTAVLRGRKKTGKAVDHELRDLDKLRSIVVDFLGVKPWANSRGNDPANWTTYIKPYGNDGKRRKAPSLRATLQSLVVRHRLDVIHSEIPLPRLHNKVVHLEPTFHDKLSLNLFIFILAVNAVTSERQDQDYMFHSRNRKHLARVINNLRQAGFWWTGSDFELQGTIDVATKYLENNREKMTEDDIGILTQGIHIARTALGSGSWDNFRRMHELGVFVSGFPPEARNFWALDPAQAQREPLLLGISQARLAQQFVTKHLQAWDPAEGLAGAGIKIRSELSNRDGFDNSTAAPKKTTPESSVKRKSAKQTFNKGFFKELASDSPLMGTKLVATASAKLTYLLDQVQEYYKTEKIIIFYDNNNSAYWIAEGLELLGIDFRIYANTLKPALREEYLTLFRESDQVRVLLMDLRQASHGLHIAHASRVYIVNPIWQPNIESQAIKRAHRIGQIRPVFVETLVLQDTLEDKILRRRKAMSDTEIQNDLLDDSTMSSIIQHERFIPMPSCEDSTALAFLRHPTGFFDRHRLPIPDNAEPEITISHTLTTPVKRKRNGDLLPAGVGSESILGLPKRKRSPPQLQFRDSYGIDMDSPQRSIPPSKREGMGKTSIIALSGPSSSGKTTLARLLQRIFAHLDTDSEEGQTKAPPISTFIIHEDDFYHPDDKIPYTTTKSGTRIQDWDCVEALDTNFLSASLRYVHEHGHLPPRLKSKEDLNDVSPDSGVDDALIEELRKVARDRLLGLDLHSVLGKEEEAKWTLAILEGFLLFAPPVTSEDTVKHPLRLVHDQIDVHLFLPAPYDLVKERREKRSGYVTIGPAPVPDLPQRSSVSDAGNKEEEDELDLEAEDDRPAQNFWTDPPGYVDDIVWPRYVRDHAWLLLAEDEGSLAVLGYDDDELIRKVGQGVTLRTDAGVTVAPGQGSLPMAELLKWGVEEVLNHLQQSSGKV
ncbi:P-loop containing nucleoside triphosphate hydrolase protein [Aspergillus granulosus]|uniref:P-loop containing nucleoside triphosphate hydrolase protein n=1 Tax=Aspergillus granulosus TaxID=176169 RepID=A0ABR4I2T9_9EURO